MVPPSPDTPLPAVAASEPGPLSRPTADAPLPLVARVEALERHLELLAGHASRTDTALAEQTAWRTSVEKLEDAIQAAVMRLQEQMATVHSDLSREHAYLREKVDTLEDGPGRLEALEARMAEADKRLLLLRQTVRALAAPRRDELAERETEHAAAGVVQAAVPRPDHVLVPLLRYQVLEEAVEAYRRQPRDHRVDAAEAIARAACDLVVTVQHDG